MSRIPKYFDLGNDEFFRYSLLNCVEHCNRIDRTANLAEGLRSQLVPEPDEGFPTHRSRELEVLVSPQLIWAVILKRIRKFRAESVETPRMGRLISVEYMSSNHDGSAQVATGGYFSRWDLPPWDTWLYLAEWILIAYVPPQAISLVENAMTVECMGILNWEDELLRICKLSCISDAKWFTLKK